MWSTKMTDINLESEKMSIFHTAGLKILHMSSKCMS